MVLAERYMNFLKGLYEATGDESVVQIAGKFKAMCEANYFRPLLVPDSIRQNAVIDWKGLTHQVPYATNTSGTSAPDVLPDGGMTPIAGHCTRDIGEETREAKWEPPDLMKNGHVLAKKTARPNVIQSVPLDKMIERAKRTWPTPMQWSVSLNHMPMQCGYSITCPNNQNGVYAGDGAGASADAGGGAQ